MKKILIIEDDDVIGTGLKYYLDAEDYEVYLAKNAKESLSIINNINDLNIILLDINLPDMSGFDLFKKIKEIKNIPIIFLTANDLEISIVRGLDMGADDYITKPFKARELISRINAVLRSIGLTPQGFNKILRFESLFFGLKSLLYALPVSIGIIYLMHLSMRNTVEIDMILIPWKSILMAVILVFIVITISMTYATRKIKKENILDAIREENI